MAAVEEGVVVAVVVGTARLLNCCSYNTVEAVEWVLMLLN